jgi:hypothetical protein
MIRATQGKDNGFFRYRPETVQFPEQGDPGLLDLLFQQIRVKLNVIVGIEGMQINSRRNNPEDVPWFGFIQTILTLYFLTGGGDDSGRRRQ